MGHRAIVPQATIAARHALLLMEIFAFTLAFCLGWLICAAMIDLLVHLSHRDQERRAERRVVPT
jgi:uncharacterized membrane protein YciS (DUF1049 family)